MATVRWNGAILAESDHCRIVEGNYYFPPESVHREYLKPSRARSLCFWKGLASYYHIEVDGARNQDAAWYYPAPSWFARRIKNYVAFLERRGSRSIAVGRTPLQRVAVLRRRTSGSRSIRGDWSTASRGALLLLA